MLVAKSYKSIQLRCRIAIERYQTLGVYDLDGEKKSLALRLLRNGWTVFFQYRRDAIRVDPRVHLVQEASRGFDVVQFHAGLQKERGEKTLITGTGWENKRYLRPP